ncbi:MAG TPA: NUDIX domain-containing protein [Patescibacteria group bacterium]
MEKTNIVGVGLLIFAIVKGLPRIYTVKEKKAKPSIFKEAGMLGPPFETVKEIDRSIEETIWRLIKEETGIPREMIDLQKVIPESFNLIPGRPDIFTMYGYAFYKGEPEDASLFTPEDDDIEFRGWYTMAELEEEHLRIEVPFILDHFRKSGCFIDAIHGLAA